MAALLVGMSVAAVLMTVAMPAWKQMTRREKEAELVFRGQQYVRAIGLFQKRSGPGALPPSIDVLVNGRFLRKKFKDPITSQDFDLLSPVTGPGQGAPAPSGQGSQPTTTGFQGSGTVVVGQPNAGIGGSAAGGIMGVASKSRDASLRIYNGRTHYNEWQFVFVQQAQAPAAGGGGGANPNGRGGNQGGQPQRGTAPPPFGGDVPGRGRQGPGRGNIGPQGPSGGRGPQPGSPFPSPTTSPFAPRTR
jgi:type II secretory pathway pseudopilin PulG